MYYTSTKETIMNTYTFYYYLTNDVTAEILCFFCKHFCGENTLYSHIFFEKL